MTIQISSKSIILDKDQLLRKKHSFLKVTLFFCIATWRPMMTTRGQFHHHFTSSFYARISQKRKKDSHIKQLFALLRPAHVDEIDPRWKHVRSKWYYFTLFSITGCFLTLRLKLWHRTIQKIRKFCVYRRYITYKLS